MVFCVISYLYDKVTKILFISLKIASARLLSLHFYVSTQNAPPRVYSYIQQYSRRSAAEPGAL